jgi:hypothetical protein
MCSHDSSQGNTIIRPASVWDVLAAVPVRQGVINKDEVSLVEQLLREFYWVLNFQVEANTRIQIHQIRLVINDKNKG